MRLVVTRSYHYEVAYHYHYGRQAGNVYLMVIQFIAWLVGYLVRLHSKFVTDFDKKIKTFALTMD